MTKLTVLQIDAFTNIPFEGNQCAVIFGADSLDDETMLSLAREMNLAETAFIVDSKVADAGVRFFTPAEEIPLAGHPTIATVYALAELGMFKLTEGKQTKSLELKAGLIEVELDSSNNVLNCVTMSLLKPQFMATYEPEIVLPIFELSIDDLLPNASIQTVSAGTPQLMIPIRDIKALLRAQMDITAYNKFKSERDFFNSHLFCLEGATEEGDTFARDFGTPPDLLEDPFTGSATGAMAAFLWHHKLIDEPTFVAEQGHWMNRPGRAKVEIIGSPDDIETVKVSGSAVTVMKGEIFL